MVSTITDRLYGESSGVAVKAPVVAASPVGVQLPLTGLASVGGYAPQQGDRILVWQQGDPSTNGIYNASVSAWTRSGDFDGAYDCVQGTLVIAYLSTGQSLIWQLVTADPVIGTTALVFVPYTITSQQTPQTPAEALANITPVATNYAPGDARRYGGDWTGQVASDAAWAAAVAQASQQGGSEITGPGTYLLNTGIVIATSGVKLRTSGMGATTFKAGANNIILLKVAASYCQVGSYNADANGHTGIDGLVLAPVNEADTAHTSQINFNEFGAIQLLNGINNGIRLRAGPTVATVDSGMFYNRFEGVWPRDCIRSIWLQDTINGGTGGPYRNMFFGCRAGSSGTVCNTGMQIDCGSTNQFFALHFEGIANGATPNAVPTAVKIANLGANTVANNDNQFYGCFMEANTRDLDNANPTTIIVGGYWTAAKFGGGGVYPGLVLTTNPSQLPIAIPGLLYSEGVAGFPSGYWGMTKEIADNGKEWQAYALSVANVTNAGSVANATSNYRQLANMVEWTAIFQFDASVGATQVTINPPVAPNAAQYTSLVTNAPFYTFSVNNGSGVTQVPGGWTNTGKLYLTAPTGGWNTAGNNNTVAFQVSYHA